MVRLNDFNITQYLPRTKEDVLKLVMVAAFGSVLQACGSSKFVARGDTTNTGSNDKQLEEVVLSPSKTDTTQVGGLDVQGFSRYVNTALENNQLTQAYYDLVAHTPIIYFESGRKFTPFLVSDVGTTSSSVEHVKPVDLMLEDNQDLKLELFRFDVKKGFSVVDSPINQDLSGIYTLLTIDMETFGQHKSYSLSEVRKNTSNGKPVVSGDMLNWHSTHLSDMYNTLGMVQDMDPSTMMTIRKASLAYLQFNEVDSQLNNIVLHDVQDKKTGKNLVDIMYAINPNDITDAMRPYLSEPVNKDDAFAKDFEKNNPGKKLYHIEVGRDNPVPLDLSLFKRTRNKDDMIDLISNTPLFAKMVNDYINPTVIETTKIKEVFTEVPISSGVSVGVGGGYVSTDGGVAEGRVSLGYMFDNGIELEGTLFNMAAKDLDTLNAVYNGKFFEGTKEEVYKRLLSFGAELSIGYRLSKGVSASVFGRIQDNERSYENVTFERELNRDGTPSQEHKTKNTFKKSNLSYGAGLGLEWQISDHFSLQGRAGYMHESKPDFNLQKFKPNSYNANLNLKYAIGGGRRPRGNLPSGKRGGN